MNENFISWNVTNWITILVMVALGFTILGFLGVFYHNVFSSGNQANA
jgi:hypothetical protein